MSGDPTLNVDAVFISMRDADTLRASPLLQMPAPQPYLHHCGTTTRRVFILVRVINMVAQGVYMCLHA